MFQIVKTLNFLIIFVLIIFMDYVQLPGFII